MGEATKASAARAIDWDMHMPTDSPFISDPAMVPEHTMPTPHVRRMEEAQRLYAAHNARQQNFFCAYNQSAWTLGMQCGWLGVGTWLAVRGYRYADPVQSLVSGFTSNRVICRVFTPLVLLGLTISSVTAFQLPSDVRLFLAARAACHQEDVYKAKALSARAMAIREGKAVMDRLKEDEGRAFEVGVTETAASSG